MRLRVEPRTRRPALLPFLALLLAVLAAVAADAAVFAIMGYAPGASLFAFFVAPLLTANGWAELALKAGPLAMIAVGLSMGYRANVWNIGAEGQLTAGAIAAGAVALAFWNEEGVWILPLVGAAGVAGGMLWVALPAFLRARLGVNEILTSLMLTYVAGLLLTLLVFGPFKDPEGFNFPQSRMFSDAATLSPLVAGYRPTWGTLLEFLVPVAVWLLMERTLLGFQIRTAGLAPAAARYAGFSEARIVWTVLLASGGLAGLAGAIEVAGPVGQLVPQITPGYGFTAIIVAFLGRLHPLGIIPAALLVALSYIGGETAQVSVGLPKGATGLVQGLLLFFPLASDFFVRFRLRLVRTSPGLSPAA